MQYLIYILFFLKNGIEIPHTKANDSIMEKYIFKTKKEKKEYKYASIEDKIIILKNIGLSKKEVYNKLKNNMDFRILLKNGNNKFYKIYDCEDAPNAKCGDRP